MSVQTRSLPAAGNVRMNRISLSFDASMTEARWEDVLRDAAVASSCAQWWIGDALDFGEIFHREGETEYQRACAITGLDEQYLRQCKMLATRFPVLRRRNTLSWSHHREVAPFDDPAEQDAWLDRAERGGWSVKTLRDQIALVKTLEPPAENGTHLVPFSLRTDEERVERWRAAAQAAGVVDDRGHADLRTWALKTLDEAAA
jgi:hypothetical protein